MARFFLGTDRTHWLWHDDIRHPLFVSNRTLRVRKSYGKATVDWCLDSGGFSELSLFGRWVTTEQEYIDKVREYRDKIGRLLWAAPQDWMCEPHMIAKTGKTVNEHQRLTCENIVKLRSMAPDLNFIPVLQGWEPDDYHRHNTLYLTYGIDCSQEAIVGVGSICRRARVAGIADVFRSLKADGYRLHGFGLKADALRIFGDSLESSDSMAWSLAARMEAKRGIYPCGVPHPTSKSCNHCLRWAQMWADKMSSIKQEYPV